MKKVLAYGILAALFFLAYMTVLRLLWILFVPASTVTDIAALLVTVLVGIPLAVVSAWLFARIIRKHT